MKLSILNKIISVVFILFSFIAVNAQSVSILGVSNVDQNDIESYFAKPSTGITIIGGSWSVTGGIIQSESAQNITILWTTVGTQTISYTGAYSGFGTVQATKLVTVAAVTAPNAPSNPTIISQVCTSATLQNSGSIPSGEQWYWQGTNSSGTSTSLVATSNYTATSSNTFYIRAKNTSTGMWSASSGSVQVIIGSIGGTTWYADTDGDGLGDPATTTTSCSQPTNYVSNSDDLCPGSYGLVGNNGCPFVNGSTNENYLYTISPQISIDNISELLEDKHSLRNISYFDGLGRGTQSIAIQAGGSKKDIVTHVEYDDLGRQVKDYLPYASTYTDGRINTAVLSETEAFYFDAKYQNTTNPYSEKTFENSPLNRILEQAAPGNDWKKGTTYLTKGYSDGNSIKFEYDANGVSEVKRFTVTLTFANNTYTPILVDNGTFDQAVLYKTITKDENWKSTQSSALIKDHTTEEFKNKQGQVVLKRTYSNIGGTSTAHDTYYVYDDYGNLTYVLPPKSEPAAGLPSATILKELCYQYKYDNRNRLVEKRIPGKGWEFIVYDKLDRPVLTEDAVQKPDRKWLFTKYDALGRVIYTGIYTHTNVISAQYQMQQHFDSQNTGVLYETKASNTGYDNTYYNNTLFPNTNIEILTVNYYDNYTFDRAGSGTPQSLPTVYGDTLTTNVKGLSTGSKVKVLNNNNEWITTVSYYDDKARPIYVYSFNDFLNTTDRVESDLDFVGKVNQTKTYHTNTNNTQATIITEDVFTYDHMGRLEKQTQAIDGDSTPEVIVFNTYDDLGQLVSKNVGNTDLAPLQRISYTYNVRGWLKNINQDTNSDNDLFNFTIMYNDITDVSKKLYNGNISQTSWNTLNIDSSTKTYDYTYDALNRITSAIDNTSNYNLDLVAYDKNGNITALNREGHIVENPILGLDANNDGQDDHFGAMDNLSYAYNTGNKLQSVNEVNGGNPIYGFKDGNTNGNDYDYDDNGNMTQDLNKGIGVNGISYNHLNLPTQVTINGQDIDYIYDATGVKLRKTVSGTTTDYAGNYVYENDVLQFFNHPEGYVTPDGSGGFDYVYQYLDHLGNVRLSYADNVLRNGTIEQNEIIEENNYYPFGLKHKGYNDVTQPTGNSVAQKFKFNGVEYEDNTGLYEMQWRGYDPSLGRFMQTDPYAELTGDVSTFQFANNNPLFWSDPEGLTGESFMTVYKDEDGNVLLDTDDGSDDVVVVPDSELANFKDLIEVTPTERSDTKEWNDHFKSEFLDVTLEELSLLDRFTTQWARQKAINYWQNPTVSNGVAMSFAEALSQWTDPQQVLAAASIIAVRPRAKPIEAYNRRKHYGNTPTKADRTHFGANKDEVIDHTTPLVKHYYEGANGSKPGHTMSSQQRKAFAKDRAKMQVQSRKESNKQGGKMSAYSKKQKKKNGS